MGSGGCQFCHQLPRDHFRMHDSNLAHKKLGKQRHMSKVNEHLNSKQYTSSFSFYSPPHFPPSIDAAKFNCTGYTVCHQSTARYSP